jgi:alpha-1,2-glucosyltransferase
VNALLAVAIIQVAYAISMELQQRRALPPGSSNHHHQQQQQQQQQQQKFATSIALLVGTLPTQLFFAFLFYTDVPSLLFLLLTELLLLRHAPRTAAVAGAAAIGMRQTNAVWVTFLTGASILHDLLQSAPRERSQTGSSSEAVINTVTAGRGPQQGSKQQKGQQQQQQQQRPGPMAELWQLLDLAWQQFWQLFSEYCLLLLLPVVFCIFVVINGGITLGDKAAHAPTSHLMQPLYFGLFTLIGAWPLLLQPVVLTRLRNAISSAPVLSAAVIAAAAALAVGFVAKYTLVHPYLLADNRHYTFYIWRKVFAKHWLPRYCLTPGYVLAWLLLLAALSATQHWLWVAAFVMSCWVTLVPAWLVEFRWGTRVPALHCTALHCTALHCTALHCTALHCTALHCRQIKCCIKLAVGQTASWRAGASLFRSCLTKLCCCGGGGDCSLGRAMEIVIPCHMIRCSMLLTITVGGREPCRLPEHITPHQGMGQLNDQSPW